MIVRIVIALVLISSAASGVPPSQGIGERLLKALTEPFMPTPDIRVSSACRAQSKYFVDELSRFSTWALNMYDASTKIPAGLITGNIRQLGGFSQCIDINHETQTNLGVIHGKHCAVSVLLKDPATKNSSSAGTGDLTKLLGAAFQASGLRGRRDSAWASWTLCVPSGCSANDVEETMRWRLASAVSPEPPPTTVVADACQIATDSPATQPFRTLDLAFISTIIILVAFATLSSLYDIVNFKPSEPRNKPSSVWEKVIVAFSVRRSGRQLFACSPSKDTVDCLHGLRVLSTCWVVLLHTGYTKATAPSINSALIPRLGDYWENMIVMNSTLSTDTFFLVSGLLLARGFLRKTHKFNLIMFYWHRFIRLIPVQMMLVWFNLTLLYRIGFGPLWASTVGSERDNCVENWWTNLLFINNYVGVSKPCMQHTWYLAVDMQLVLASPLILIPLKRAPRFGGCLLALLLLAAIAAPFGITYVDQLPPAMLYTVNSQKIGEVYLKIYTNMYTRAGPYLIGMVLALYMHHCSSNERLPNIVPILAWLTATVSCLAALFGVFTFYQTGHPYKVLEASSYAAFHRSAWASGIAWIIFACVRGYGGIVNRFLSWSAFVPLSQLSFSVYLCHYIFLLINVGSMRTPAYFSQYDLIQQCLSTLMISTACSVILFVLIEYPVMSLDKIFTSLISEKPSTPHSSASPQSINPVKIDVEADPDQGYDNEGYEKSFEDDSNNPTNLWVVR